MSPQPRHPPSLEPLRTCPALTSHFSSSRASSSKWKSCSAVTSMSGMRSSGDCWPSFITTDTMDAFRQSSTRSPNAGVT